MFRVIWLLQYFPLKYDYFYIHVLVIIQQLIGHTVSLFYFLFYFFLFDQKPKVYQSTSTNKTFICSTHNEILRLILKYLHCDIEIIKSDYNYGGKQTNNGKWDGILSYFDNKASFF